MAIESPKQLEHGRKDSPLLALEIRTRRFGFAVLQGDDLLDSGVCSFGSGPSAHSRAIRKVAFLLRLYVISTIVARRTRRARGESAIITRNTLRSIRAAINRRSASFDIVDRSTVAKFYRSRNCVNKHDIAKLLARQFSDLRGRVTPPRKPWNPESYAAAIFDAVANGVAFANMTTTSIGP